MIDYASVYKSQMAFTGLDLDKPRMNAELRVMMAEMQLRLNWTKLKITPLDILISASRDETFSCKVKLKSSQLTEATSCNRDVFSHINTPLDTTSKCGPVWEIVYMRRFAPFDTICTI